MKHSSQVIYFEITILEKKRNVMNKSHWVEIKDLHIMTTTFVYHYILFNQIT